MKYKFENIYGKPLSNSLRVFKKVINNGWVIETDDEALFDQLEADEKDRTGEPIDWHIFKDGETVLIDNIGRNFACTIKGNGRIQLIKILNGVDCHLRTAQEMEEYLNSMGLNGKGIFIKAHNALKDMKTIFIPEIKCSLHWIYRGEQIWNLDGKNNSNNVNDYKWQLL